jgi:hypothetical protein
VDIFQLKEPESSIQLTITATLQIPVIAFSKFKFGITTMTCVQCVYMLQFVLDPPAVLVHEDKARYTTSYNHVP